MMAGNPDYHGGMTLSDGSRIALSPDEAKALWEAMDKLTDDELATMAECAKADAEYMDRLGRAFGEDG